MSADQSLPFDIVAQVVAQAQQATLTALRLTSRDCYGFATSRLYRKVELRARYDSASASVDAVCVGNFLQSILDNHRLGEWMTWLVIARPLDSDLLLSRFAAALRLMPRLQHLDCWGIQAAIQHDASLVEWVAMHAQLRSVFLYLKLDRSCFDPLLDALPCVSALTIRGARHGMRPFRMPALERLLLRSRQSLRSLELDTNYDLDGWEHDISFKNAWPQLKELGLLRMPSLAAARAFVHVEHLRVHEGYRADIPDFLTDSTSFPRLAWLQVCPRAANHALEPARRQLRHLKLTMESVRAIESRRFLNYVATFHWPSLASLHITLVQERWWPLTMDALRRHLPECHGLRYLCYWTDLIPMQEGEDVVGLITRSGNGECLGQLRYISITMSRGDEWTGSEMLGKVLPLFETLPRLRYVECTHARQRPVAWRRGNSADSIIRECDGDDALPSSYEDVVKMLDEESGP